MWLLSGAKASDHNTINRFRGERLTAALEDLFYQLVEVLGQLGEIDYKNIFVDGTKIEANANKYSFVWKKSTMKHEALLQEKLLGFFEEINKTYGTLYKLEKDSDNLLKLQGIYDFLKMQIGLELVSGTGKRKKPLQKHFEKASEYHERQKNTVDTIKSLMVAIVFQRLMHMKEDHMRNAQ